MSFATVKPTPRKNVIEIQGLWLRRADSQASGPESLALKPESLALKPAACVSTRRPRNLHKRGMNFGLEFVGVYQLAPSTAAKSAHPTTHPDAPARCCQRVG